MSAGYKLGSFSPSGEPIEHRYPGCWDVQRTTGPDRLVVAPAGGQIPMLIDLMRQLPEPFGLLYVLVVSRQGHEPGRYQSPTPTDRAETAGFLQTYRDYFERDARHHIWVMSLTGDATLVYDHHDLIYGYGPIADFRQSLAASGLARGAVEIPSPHHHNYNAEHDEAERRIMEHWPWVQFPLQPDDDP